MKSFPKPGDVVECPRCANKVTLIEDYQHETFWPSHAYTGTTRCPGSERPVAAWEVM